MSYKGYFLCRVDNGLEVSKNGWGEQLEGCCNLGGSLWLVVVASKEKLCTNL